MEEEEARCEPNLYIESIRSIALSTYFGRYVGM